MRPVLHDISDNLLCLTGKSRDEKQSEGKTCLPLIPYHCKRIAISA